ncbi:MAG: NAD(P)/FAD-dependent oxidoreductase [Maribacter sp.]
MERKVIIVGAGLTGLLTAYRLQELGFEVTVLEARDRIGGRIHTITSGSAKVEMGATWFNDGHYDMKEIIEEFELPYFEQFLQGKSYFQTFSNVPPQEINVPNDSPSYRFKLGTESLLNAIYSRLKPNTVVLNELVIGLDFKQQEVVVTTSVRILNAEVVITTIPPALLLHQIKFTPALPKEMSTVMENTHTWMQDSIKIALTYQRAFWRERGQSGTIFSNVGPLTEFYDQSNPEENSFALVGFASGNCARLSKEQRIEKIEGQLKMVFGADALAYESHHETLWFNEEYTKSDQQTDAVFPHQNGGHPLYQELFFDDRLLISGSETSPHHPGYMEGAIHAAQNVVSFVNKSQS